MARFFGEMRSGLGPTGKTLTGGPGEGIKVHVRGWNLGVSVAGQADEEKGDALTRDTWFVRATRGSNGGEEPRPLVAVLGEAKDGTWGVARQGWLGEAVKLLERLTHPMADEEDVRDAKRFLQDELPGLLDDGE